MSEPVQYERAPWQVRIRRARDDLPVGGGMYCPDGHVVTCAHVVNAKCERPDGPVYVEFQHAGAHDPIPAVVVEAGWFPPAGEGDLRADVAVLQLMGEVPATATAMAVPLRPSPEGVTTTHSFHTYGYPGRHVRGGVPARGTIIGSAEFEWLSLQANGQELDPGFSGSPVWDVELGGVVGIVVVRDRPPSSRDPGARAGSGSAYAIRMEALGGYWPALQPKVVRNLPADRGSLEDLLEVGLLPSGELPTVAETSVYDIGVTPSKYVSAENPHPPYVSRHWVDRQIQDLLDAGERFIVAVGDSKSGKSRSMAEMLGRLRPRARLIVPTVSDPTALPQLTRRLLPLEAEGGVLWLDDIDRYLVPNGLDRKVLRSFLEHEPGIIVAGTITSRRYHDITAAQVAAGTSDLMTTRDPTAQFRRVLSQARVVHVASKPSPEDLAAARELYPDEDFHARGIGEQMVAAPLVEHMYAAAREACPEGWAVIQAAVDWRRIGVPGAVSRPTLRSLFPRYLSEVAPHLEPDEDRFSAGLTWAIKPLVGTIALLTIVEPGQDRASYRAFDYVLACAEGLRGLEPTPVAPLAWDEAIASLGADELLVVTQAAVIRGEADIARQAAEAARGESGDPAVMARANLFLGELHATAGEIGTAIELLEKAAASGITDAVPTAQVDLGAILAQPGGDPERARALLQSAISAGDPQVTAQAQLCLGVLLMDQGDLATARPLLEAAMAAHADLADTPFVGLSRQGAMDRTRLSKETRVTGNRPGTETATSPVADDRMRVLQAVAVRRAESVHLLAQASLGGLLVNEGDLSRARLLLEAALSSNNPEVEPLARTNLGALLLRHGDLQAARQQLEQVLANGDTAIGQFAQISLGCVLAVSGETERGYEMLETVAASDNVEQAPRALCLLGEFYLEDGQREAAESYLQRAIESGHRDWAPYAKVTSGMLRAREGDIGGARELLEAVVAARHPGESARAADALGDLLLNTGDLTGAEDAYQRAISFRHPWWSAVATIDLARVRAQQDEIEESAALLRSVIDGGDPNAAPMAQDTLGDLLRFRAGNPAGARAAYQQAIDSGHPDWSVVARLDMAQLLDAEDDRPGAQEQLRQITQGPNRIYAAQAWDLMGDLLARSADSPGAQEAYQQAIDAHVPEWSAVAQVDLAHLILTETDNVDEAEPLLSSAATGPRRDVAASARLLLGLIAVYRGDSIRAREEFQRAADTGPAQVAGPALIQIAKIHLDDGDLAEAAALLEPLMDGSLEDESLELYAAAHLGVVRLRQGDPAAALPLLERGAASDDPDTSAYAHLNLGTLLFDLGHVDEAGEVLAIALEAGQPEVVNSARVGLGMVRLAQGSLDEANNLLTAALRDGNTADEPKARRYLGSVLARQGRRDEARIILEPLADSADAEHRAGGLLLLGRLAVQNNDATAGKRWLTAAVEAGDPEVENEARLELGRLLAESGDPEGSRRALTPLLDQDGTARAEAEDRLGELTAAETFAPPARRPLPRGRPDAIPLARAAGTAAETPAPPAPLTPPAPASETPGLAPLPPAVLAALVDIAEADGQVTEAAYWRGVLASLPPRPERLPAGRSGAEVGHHGHPAVSRPHHERASARPARPHADPAWPRNETGHFYGHALPGDVYG